MAAIRSARLQLAAPTAELRPNQKDEDSLPPYPVLDPILKAYVEDDRSVDEMVEMGFDRKQYCGSWDWLIGANINGAKRRSASKSRTEDSGKIGGCRLPTDIEACNRMFKKDGSARPQRAKRRGVLCMPYAELLSDARTKLTAFFNILGFREEAACG